MRHHIVDDQSSDQAPPTEAGGHPAWRGPRAGYHHQLAEFDGQVRDLCTQVTVGLGGAGRALLSGEGSSGAGSPTIGLLEGERIAADVLARLENRGARGLGLPSAGRGLRAAKDPQVAPRQLR